MVPASDKPKLKVILENNWNVIIKNIRVMKVKGKSVELFYTYGD